MSTTDTSNEATAPATPVPTVTFSTEDAFAILRDALATAGLRSEGAHLGLLRVLDGSGTSMLLDAEADQTAGGRDQIKIETRVGTSGRWERRTFTRRRGGFELNMIGAWVLSALIRHKASIEESDRRAIRFEQSNNLANALHAWVDDEDSPLYFSPTEGDDGEGECVCTMKLHPVQVTEEQARALVNLAAMLGLLTIKHEIGERPTEPAPSNGDADGVAAE